MTQQPLHVHNLLLLEVPLVGHDRIHQPALHRPLAAAMRSCGANSAHSRPLKWQTCRQLFRATRMCRHGHSDHLDNGSDQRGSCISQTPWSPLVRGWRRDTCLPVASRYTGTAA
jgi:hypothetical protein